MPKDHNHGESRLRAVAELPAAAMEERAKVWRAGQFAETAMRTRYPEIAAAVDAPVQATVTSLAQHGLLRQEVLVEDGLDHRQDDGIIDLHAAETSIAPPYIQDESSTVQAGHPDIVQIAAQAPSPQFLGSSNVIDLAAERAARAQVDRALDRAA